MNSLDQELFEVTRENNLAEVRRLLSVGANANAKNYSGWTPLHWASIKEVVNELREHGADIEAKDNDGSTPLHYACSVDHLAVVNELLSPGAEIDANNETNGATTILGKRKRRGANIEAEDECGNTPLHIASGQGHRAIVKALLAFGADCRAINDQGELPVDRAIGLAHSVEAKYLLQQLYATTRLPLHELLEDLTWIGSPFSSNVPPLRKALALNVLDTYDVVEILEYLVGQNNELISSVDQDGSLPLHVACRRGASFAIVQSLANLYKASVKSVTSQGDLPLFLACEMPETSLDTIFLLMQLYPDLVYR
jgi:ankyrin repeat protein